MKLIPGNKYKVKVINLVPVGAVVRMEDQSTELVHISNIADCYVKSVGDFVEIGEEYEATCQEGKNRPAELTFIPLNLKNRHEVFNNTNSDKLSSMIKFADSVFADKNRKNKKDKKRK